ncbi:putative zinc-binding metallopeptidase [Marinoscillum furvescens]|uniref:Substrate import-associated zinc metallohydrolase lipoprotein n=1 Tax=Marinoscillum furvescens DSM 4134 TaxID=1122208 RepID=A0A3D9L2D5_MARFU|nr:putative zinc-binding metallopeptidase [Marinoscillum furvescens]RED98888.1 substrate import-associated zinc metallohydrolase lipoprotein [Marinoscillum furvescens DSM 4134]
MKKIVFAISGLVIALLTVMSCYPDESLSVAQKDDDVDLNELDQYIEENFTKEYGMAIRYRYVDNYVSPNERVTPPKLDVVKPMLDFISNYWIDPYLKVTEGEEFFREHVPAEIILLGGLIYNENGTVTLGTADAGARITFTNVNAIDPTDTAWRDLQLQTVYHEFAHTVHQRYKLPASFESITPNGFTSAGSWFNLPPEEALQRGFVSPYATSSPNEDFAETVAYYLFDPDFQKKFIEQEKDCSTAACEAASS